MKYLHRSLLACSLLLLLIGAYSYGETDANLGVISLRTLELEHTNVGVNNQLNLSYTGQVSEPIEITLVADKRVFLNESTNQHVEQVNAIKGQLYSKNFSLLLEQEETIIDIYAQSLHEKERGFYLEEGGNNNIIESDFELKNVLHVYRNSAYESLKIQSEYLIQKIILVRVGKSYPVVDQNKTKATLLGNLPSGIYLLNAIDKHGKRFQQKVTIQHE